MTTDPMGERLRALHAWAVRERDSYGENVKREIDYPTEDGPWYLECFTNFAATAELFETLLALTEPVQKET
jgi:hypothetical protein